MYTASELISNKDVRKTIKTDQYNSDLTLVATMHYHTGRHPLGKIREENGNIQNYQTSIKYEI